MTRSKVTPEKQFEKISQLIQNAETGESRWVLGIIEKGVKKIYDSNRTIILLDEASESRESLEKFKKIMCRNPHIEQNLNEVGLKVHWEMFTINAYVQFIN